MPQFSQSSKAKLLTCHPHLQDLFNEVIKRRDCTIVSGRRGKAEQDELYRRGMSMKKYPYSKHNTEPLSSAVDVMPYFDTDPHLRWDDTESMYEFAGYVARVADEFGIVIRRGCDWDNDMEFDDQTFIDVAHYELILDSE